MNENHLTPKQIAERTSLHVETIRRLCRKRDLAPVIIVGNRILIPESTYREFLKSHSVKPKEAQ